MFFNMISTIKSFWIITLRYSTKEALSSSRDTIKRLTYCKVACLDIIKQKRLFNIVVRFHQSNLSFVVIMMINATVVNEDKKPNS